MVAGFHLAAGLDPIRRPRPSVMFDAGMYFISLQVLADFKLSDKRLLVLEHSETE